MTASLTILIPCFNESARLVRTIRELEEWMNLSRDFTVSVLFVNDGSTDDTEEKLTRLKFEATVITSLVNLGKGGAIAHGMKFVESDYVLVMDADLSTSLEFIPLFFKHIQEGPDLVIANRFHPLSHVERPWWRSFFSYVFFFVIHGLGSFKSFDTQCGFKMYKTATAKDLFKSLRFNRYSFDLEVIKNAELKYQIAELPVSWKDRGGSKVKLWRDGFGMIKDVLSLK